MHWINEDYTELWKTLEQQSLCSNAFKDYFSKCAYVQDKMKRGDDLTGEAIAEWAEVEMQAPNTSLH